MPNIVNNYGPSNNPQPNTSAIGHVGKALKRGAREGVWLGAAGLALGAKGGLLAKHLAPKAGKYLGVTRHIPGTKAHKIMKHLDKYKNLSSIEAMKRGVKGITKPFRSMSTKDKALVGGLGMTPGVVSYPFSEEAKK